MKKRILTGIICTSLIAGMGITSAGAFTPQSYATDLSVYLNGENVYANSDNKPCIMNDRTMVQLRPIFEKMGCSVTYDDATKTATFAGNSNVGFTFTNGSYDSHTLASDDGSIVNTYTFDVPATIYNDTFYVPLRAFCEMLDTSCVCDISIEWDDASRSVYLECEMPNSVVSSTLSFEEAKAKAEAYVNDTSISVSGDDATVTYNGKAAYAFKLYSKELIANGGSGFLGEIIYVYIDNSGVENDAGNSTVTTTVADGEYLAYSGGEPGDGIALITVKNNDDGSLYIEYQRRHVHESGIGLYNGNVYLRDNGVYSMAGEDYGVTLQYTLTPVDAEHFLFKVEKTGVEGEFEEELEYIKK